MSREPAPRADFHQIEGPGHRAAVASQDLLLVPGALVDELLQGLVGVLDVEQLRRPGDAGGHRLDALALPVLEQAAEVDAAPGSLGMVPEVVVKQLGVVAKSPQDFGRQFGCESLVHDIHTNIAANGFV